jgi:hypothetical protein
MARKKPARKKKSFGKKKPTRKRSAASKKVTAKKKPMKKAATGKSVAHKQSAAKKKSAVKKKFVDKKKSVAKKRTVAEKKAVARRATRGRAEVINPVTPRGRRGVGAESGGQSGDTQGLSRQSYDDSESVEELMEEGQYMEAEAVSGVENARDADQGEVRTRQFPEDDVPQEYKDED